MVSTRN